MKTFIKQIKQLFIDIRNRKKFKNEMAAEFADPNSKMNALDIKIDKDYKTLSVIINVPEEFQQAGLEIDIMNKLKELSRPITNYICYELGWMEYIYVPEYYYIDDPEKPNMSRSYIATWKYAPLVMNNTKFWVKLIASIIGIITVITGSVLALVL